MKKYIINKLVLAAFSVLLLVSCEKDFLEKVNPNAQSTATFWRNNVDLNSGLTTAYHALANDNVLQMTNESNRSDLSWPGFNRLQSSNPFYNQTFNDGDGGIASKWDGLYAIIFRANQVIINGERLKGTYLSDETIQEATEIIAQARFLRGWAYYTLYWMYNEGSVVIFDFVPESEADFFQPLSSPSDVRDFFLWDLEYARENLPVVWEDAFNKGRVTAGTATAVLGKNYLYEKDFTSAAELFADVITNPDYGYRLTNNIEDNFSEAGEFNSESIFEIGYSVIEKAEFTGFDFRNTSNRHNKSVAPVGGGGFRSIVPSAWLAVAYKEDVMDTVDARNYVDSIGADDGETYSILRDYSLRTSYSIALPDDLDTPYYGELTTPQAGNFNNKEYAYFRKYSNWRTVRSEQDFQPDYKSPLNVRLIRLADVYLMMAECMINGGSNDAGVEGAMVLVNEIRRRSGLRLLGLNGTGLHPANDHDNIGYSARTLMDHIMYFERPLELSIEGQATRFLDLRRWDVLSDRFNELSTREYHLLNNEYINEDGNTSTKWGANINAGLNPDTSADPSGVYDNLRASENYIPSLNDYYPIPSTERNSNPKL